MNTDQLSKFLTIAKQRSMSRAADMLFVTPSALSHSIQNLEDELGTQLFIRNKKGIILTASGEILYKYAQKIDDLSEEAINAVKTNQNIVIASNNLSASFVLSRLPDEDFSKVSIMHYKSSQMPDLLLKGAVDALICDDFYMKQAFVTGQLNSNDVNKVIVYRENLGLFVPPNHELFNKRKLTYAEVKDIPLCLQMDRLSLQEWLKNIEATSGVSFKINFSLDKYSYSLFRDKIPLPELREINTIFNPKIDKVISEYRFVKFDDFYSNRYIYMWFMKSKTEKVKMLLKSIIDFYKVPN